MNRTWIVVIVLIALALICASGIGPWNNGYFGYVPSGSVSVVIVVLVIFLLVGWI